MKKIKWICFLFSVIFLLSSCAETETKKEDIKISSKDGLVSFMIPTDWQAANLGVDNAIIQAGGLTRKKYLMVVQEKTGPSKETITLDDYDKRILKEYEDQYNGTDKEFFVAQTTKEEIDKKKSKIHTIYNKKDGLTMGTQIVLIEGKENFYQIVFWSDYASFDFLSSEFLKIARSFKGQ